MCETSVGFVLLSFSVLGMAVVGGGSNAIYVTEGALKWQIAHFLSGKPFVATAGVNQQKELEILFQRLQRESQCKMIIDAFDMDDHTNEHVRRGHQNLAWLADKVYCHRIFRQFFGQAYMQERPYILCADIWFSVRSEQYKPYCQIVPDFRHRNYPPFRK